MRETQVGLCGTACLQRPRDLLLLAACSPHRPRHTAPRDELPAFNVALVNVHDLLLSLSLFLAALSTRLIRTLSFGYYL